MPNSNPYRSLVSAYAELLATQPVLTAEQAIATAKQHSTTTTETAPKALIFAPHPDDECIIGGLPLRLLRERKLNVLNVAVTQGSNKDRQAERWQELSAACGYLGFGLLATAERGLQRINPLTREQDPEHWSAAVAVIAGILTDHRPAVIFIPHDDDWNRTHIGTHYLVLDALARLPQDFSCLVIETEFWGAMATPNLLVESSTEDVADLVAALSLHHGEVARIPYHLRLPAWLIDNVRRGAELVKGQGEAAPEFAFATPYRLRRWRDGRLQIVIDNGRFIACGDDLGALLTL